MSNHTFAEIIENDGVHVRRLGCAPGLLHVLFYTEKARDAYLAELPSYRRARCQRITREWHPNVLAELTRAGHVELFPR